MINRPPNGSCVRLCLRPPEQLDDEERDALQRVLDEDPPLATAHSLMQRFRQVVRDRDLHCLDRWLIDAAASERAASELQQANCRPSLDSPAALLLIAPRSTPLFMLPWSTGQVEGSVHKIKLLKRQAYGRAGLPQLRARILAA